MKNNRIYSEDIKTATRLKNETNMAFAINMFRLNENQAKLVEKEIVGHTYSINSPSAKLARQNNHNRVVTPRMTEAAASMIHAGYTQQEIARIFDVDHRTLSVNLLQYDGYKSKTTNRFKA